MAKQQALTAAELLDRMLRGETVTPEVLGQLVSQRMEEGPQVEFKGAGFLDTGTDPVKPGDPQDFKGKLRKWVAGFVNCRGGALVIGISDKGGPDAQGMRHSTGRAQELDAIDKKRAKEVAKQEVARKLSESKFSSTTGHSANRC